MKVKSRPTEEVMREEFQTYLKQGYIRDPRLSIAFLRPLYTIGDMVNKKPIVKVEHCPSDIFF